MLCLSFSPKTDRLENWTNHDDLNKYPAFLYDQRRLDRSLLPTLANPNGTTLFLLNAFGIPCADLGSGYRHSANRGASTCNTIWGQIYFLSPGPSSTVPAVIECADYMPPSAIQSLLNQSSVDFRFRDQLALVTPLIAHKTSSNDVAPPIPSPILPGKQMLCSTLELSGLAKCDAVQASKVLDGATPHRKVAVIAATTLAFEGCGAGFDEGFRLSRHGGLLIN